MIIDLSTNAGYDIAGAIRGPDMYYGYDETKGIMLGWIKHTFTGRLRWLVGARGYMVLRESAVIDEPDNLRLFADQLAAMKANERASWVHYFSHLSDAFIRLYQDTVYQNNEVLFLSNICEFLSTYASSLNNINRDRAFKVWRKLTHDTTPE
jgi:hypothetical protein